MHTCLFCFLIACWIFTIKGELTHVKKWRMAHILSENGKRSIVSVCVCLCIYVTQADRKLLSLTNSLEKYEIKNLSSDFKIIRILECSDACFWFVFVIYCSRRNRWYLGQTKSSDIYCCLCLNMTFLRSILMWLRVSNDQICDSIWNFLHKWI